MLKFALFGGVFLALVGCGAILERRIQSRTEAAIDEYPPEGQIIDVNGTPVHVYVEGTGPDVILIHGAGANWKDFTFAMIPELKNEFRFIAIDRPAHGYTGRIKERENDVETIAEQADLIHAAAKKIGAKDPLVVGQSYGGAVALSYGLRHGSETAGLLIISGVSNPWEGKLARWYRVMGSTFGRKVLTPLASAYANERKAKETVTDIFSPDPVPEGYLDHMGFELAVRPTQVSVNIAMVNNMLPQITEQSKQYGMLEMPVEIVHGTADETVGYEIHAVPLSKQVKGANLTSLEGVGHMPHHTSQSQTFNALRRLAKRAGLK